VNADLTGRTLGDRYDVLALLGTGGMGAVYRARDRELDELVALKVIRADLAADQDVIERFRHEVKLARRVTHPNVARSYELGNVDGVLYCTMELIEGESLTRRIGGRALPLGEAVAIACALCDALAAAHAVEVIHRDVKPDNVLITSGGRIVMADFGIAALTVSADGDPSGTPAYMAPEQARGEPPTPAADVYALALILYEMVVGRRAFGGTTAQILTDKQALDQITVPPELGVPPGLAVVIAQATARDPRMRIPSARALRAALAPWLRTQRAVTADPRPSIDPRDVTTVVALAPHALDASAPLYLAEAIRELAVDKLARVPRLRVLRRATEHHDHVLAISMQVSDALAVTIGRSPASSITLRLPLAADRIDAAADAIVGMVTTAIVVDEPVTSDRVAIEALDLRLSAHHLMYSNLSRLDEALDLLGRAERLVPDDPRIEADLAIGHLRRAFFSQTSSDLALIEQAIRYANAARDHGPELVGSHLAMGLVELTTGDPAIAAGHFRIAIARAPQSAESHEQLGRMLLEAGFLAQGRARLEEALAIAPSTHQPLWDLERARVLEGEWTGHAERVAELIRFPANFLVGRARFAWWRGAWDDLAALRTIVGDSTLLPDFIAPLIDVVLERKWGDRKDPLIAFAMNDSPRNLRRRAFCAQLLAEVAAILSDHEVCLAMLERAVSQGLFDLHWLVRAPTLAAVRELPAYVAIHARVRRRADAILDALHGEHGVTMFETR